MIHRILMNLKTNFSLSILSVIFVGLSAIEALATETVVIVNSTFSPEYIEIDSCNSIDFINLDPVDHRLIYPTEKNPRQTVYLLGWGMIGMPNPHVENLIFDPGTYVFKCLPHPWMNSVKVHVVESMGNCPTP